MSFHYPIVVAVAVLAALVLGAVVLRRSRPRTWRHLVPQALFLTAAGLLLLAVARPEATLPVANSAGTVVLAFDVSNSMQADDVKPTRLGAAAAAATEFVQSQPDTVSFGIVAFDQGALTTQQPTPDHDATTAAIKRLKVNGGTSLGQAVLAALTVIVGKPVNLPGDGQDQPDLGYWGSATIVLLSDGEDTGGPDATAAASLAAKAGVRIETVGVGTVEGATVTVNGYQIATALDEDRLTEIATTTAGTYHRADNADALRDVYQHLDLRLTTQRKPVELTGAAAAIAVALLTLGGLLMTTWFGRIL